MAKSEVTSNSLDLKRVTTIGGFFRLHPIFFILVTVLCLRNFGYKGEDFLHFVSSELDVKVSDSDILNFSKGDFFKKYIF